MVTTWGPQECGDHMGTTWGQHGDHMDVETMWGQHGDNMVTTGTTGMWRLHGDIVEITRGQHKDNVGITWGPWGCGDHMGTIWRQCGGNMGTREMWKPHGDNMETTWGQHENNVETTW